MLLIFNDADKLNQEEYLEEAKELFKIIKDNP